MASTASSLLLLLMLLLLLLLLLLFPTCYLPRPIQTYPRSIALFRDASRKARFKVARGGQLGQQLRPMSSKESVKMHKDFFFAWDASVRGKERPPGLFHQGILINFYLSLHHKQRISFFHAGLCRRSGVPLDLEKNNRGWSSSELLPKFPTLFSFSWSRRSWSEEFFSASISQTFWLQSTVLV